MFKKIFFGGILAGLTLSAPLHAQVYDCAFVTKASNNGWLADRYILDYNGATNTVMVLDGLIQTYFGQAIEGKIVTDTAKKLVVTWEIQTTDSGGQLAQMQFRASYFKADQTMIVRGVPPG